MKSKESSSETLHASCVTHHGLIDTHCHLEMKEFDPDREEVIRRAREAGIEAMVTIGSDLEGNMGGLELSKKYDFIYSSVGFHPHDAKDFTEEIFDRLKGWATGYRIQDAGCRLREHHVSGIMHHASSLKNSSRLPKVVAIGEIGLDYHYDNSPREVQREAFLKQLAFAREVNLPVIVHSREAKRDTIDVIKKSGVTNGVFHCFSGDMEMAEQVMEMGFSISVAGPVTFKNARRLRDVAKAIPDEYLLIETDAPYLTPEPFRGKRNEPAYLIHTARAIAELRRISLDDISRITTLNANRLFKTGKVPERGVIAYKIRDSLYLNVTNRCTNKCSFCIRFHSDYVKGHNLRLSDEPTAEELTHEIGDPSRYKEIVFCGYGEPMLRLDLIKDVAAWVKQRRGKVRVNTNGHGNLIHGRNILPELSGLVDSMSVSLDAHDEKTYNIICKPAFKNAFTGVIDFIKEAKKYIPSVQVTVVTLPEVDIERCRKIAEELGVGFRIRTMDVVG